MKMRNFLLRMLYAVICVVLFWYVFPLFLVAIGLSLSSPVLQLMRVLIACIAVVYVLFGPDPPAPW